MAKPIDMMAQTRIIPARRDRSVKQVTKLANGGMEVEFHSGDVAVLEKGDELIQAFLIYTVINEETRELA